MVKITNARLKEAEVRGLAAIETEPRALAAHYDPVAGRVVVDPLTGCPYAFPPQLVQDLSAASAEVLAGVEVDGLGSNLHWPSLDVDLYVPALVSGVFGTRAWMARALARAAGQTISPAKSAAARSNRAKGGRPRKTATG
jgi:hypothetical protein